MKSKHEFWERVDVALDERRDPLEDEGVQAAVVEEPELLDELIALEARLAALPRHRTPRRIPRAAAAAVILVAIGAIAFELARAPKASDELAARRTGEATSSLVQNEILECSFTVTTERPGERDTVVVERAGTRRTHELALGLRHTDYGFDHATLVTEVIRP